MDFKVTPSDDGTYIEVTAIGETTREIAAEGTRVAYELGKKLGIRCFLIDATTSQNIERVPENVRFTKDDAPPIMPPEMHWVVLVDPSDQSHDFHVAFARSQGIDISLSWDRDGAIADLREAAARLNTPPPDSSSTD